MTLEIEKNKVTLGSGNSCQLNMNLRLEMYVNNGLSWVETLELVGKWGNINLLIPIYYN